jgi:hypothetical protein
MNLTSMCIVVHYLFEKIRFLVCARHEKRWTDSSPWRLKTKNETVWPSKLIQSTIKLHDSCERYNSDWISTKVAISIHSRPRILFWHESMTTANYVELLFSLARYDSVFARLDASHCLYAACSVSLTPVFHGFHPLYKQPRHIFCQLSWNAASRVNNMMWQCHQNMLFEFWCQPLVELTKSKIECSNTTDHVPVILFQAPLVFFVFG